MQLWRPLLCIRYCMSAWFSEDETACYPSISNINAIQKKTIKTNTKKTFSFSQEVNLSKMTAIGIAICHNRQMPTKLPNLSQWLDSYGDPTILLDTDYRIVAANEQYRATYRDGRALEGRTCYEISHRSNVPCDLVGEICPLKKSREIGQPSKALHIHHSPQGREYINVETRPIQNSDGEITHYIEVLRTSGIANTKPHTQGLIGKSRAFQNMLSHVDRVASTKTTVLLLGETGTGKEVVAQTIHNRSQQQAHSFVPVECAGLVETLFESELFGHAKGAFTGATSEKMGLVEAAEGGTLFLDEIGEISLSEQVKLLRLLETGEYRRVGSTTARKANFRLVCATNKNLEEMVAEGIFREDLYYRINVFEIHLPPLRDRLEDLPILIDSMIQRAALDKPITFAPQTLLCLSGYEFPGNIRELKNIVERAALMCDGQAVLPQHLPAKFCSKMGTEIDSAKMPTLKEMEKQYLIQVLASFQGNRKSLAKQLGISERVLYRKLASLQ